MSETKEEILVVLCEICKKIDKVEGDAVSFGKLIVNISVAAYGENELAGNNATWDIDDSRFLNSAKRLLSELRDC